jgi:F-type H+/Na+-transporting ATPase subunit alpha
LAQYRELAAFSQFSSDLDAETQARLSRGHLLTELLKQPQYSPLAVWQQVVTILAGTEGAFDGVPADKIKTAQESLLSTMEQKHKKIIEKLQAGEKLDDETKTKIAEVAADIARQYKPAKSSQKTPENAEKTEEKT